MGKKKWRRMGLLSAAAVLYLYAAFCCQRTAKNADLTYLVLSRSVDAVTAEAIFTQETRLEDPVGFCFWGEKAGQTVSCAQTGAYAQVTQVLVSGNPGLLGAGVLAWQKGCLIDEETALTLFGTTDCGGQILWKEAVPCRVLGTVSAFRPTMVAVAAETDGSFLDRCVLSVPARRGATLGQQFLMRWGLQGERIDVYPLWAAVHNFLLILPGILLLIVLIRGIKRVRKKPMKEWGNTAILLPAVAGLLILLCSRIRTLPDGIPSRWSDFSFWGNWLEAQRENMRLVLLTPMGERHLQMMLDMVKSILSSTAAFLIAAWTRRRQRYADPAD